MQRRSAFATWIPLAVLLVLTGVAQAVTAAARHDPMSMLFQAADAFCNAVVAGDLERARAFRAPEPLPERPEEPSPEASPSAGPSQAPSLTIDGLVALHRGRRFTVLGIAVFGGRRGLTQVGWAGVDPQMGRPFQDVTALVWQREADGRWLLTPAPSEPGGPRGP